MMAKKKKVVIVDEELTPTVLKTIKTKKGSVIWLIFIFAIFVAVVIYLPDIAVYIEEYVNPDVVTPGSPSIPDDNEQPDAEPEEVIEYQFTPDLQITDGNITLSNFAVANNQLSFTMTNNGTEEINFADLDYFINLYNANKMLLQRIMLMDETIAAGGTTNVSYDLTSTNINTISFLEISEEEYPVHTVTADESGNATLTCVKGYETVKYLLKNNKVTEIEDNFEVSATDANYSTLYSSYQALAATYNTIGGIDANVRVENNILYFTTNINLSTVSDGSFNNLIYYPRDTDAKVMNFELEANGYRCN